MRHALVCFVLLISTAIGCSRPETNFTTVGRKIGAAKEDAKGAVLESTAPAGEKPAGAIAAEPGPDKQKVDAKPKVEQPRKIKYTADMRVIVDEFDKAVEGLKEAIKAAKGLRAHEEITTSPGSPRLGTWRVRVPVDQFDGFREAVGKLGKVERNSLQTEDITAQYYDLDAHIKNRQAARDTLRDLLKDTGKKDMKAYLDVWDKLERMTDEINRAEGQLRLWANLTDLTTVTVHLYEKQKYIPEEKVKDKEEPTFGMRAGKTWSDSWDALLTFFQGTAIVAIAVTPWLPFPLVVGTAAWLVGRRLRRATPVVVAVVQEKKAGDRV